MAFPPPPGTHPPPQRLNGDAPLWSRVLSERGLGTLLAIVLVGAMLWFGVRLVSDAQAFQHQIIAESVRTNEKLEQLQLNHLEQKAQLDRIERGLLVGRQP